MSSILVLGAAQEVIWISLHAVGDLRENTLPFLLLMLGSFSLCFLSYLLLRLTERPATLLVLCFALLFRITVLPAPPYQSEDVYRYLWDARVASCGIDPFRHAPQDPELEQLRDAKIYPMLNSRPYVTAYPPLSQALFRGTYILFGDRVVPMKAVFSLLEFGTVVLAWRILLFLKLPLEPLILMAWNPFFIFEFSHSGHSDSSMMFLALLSVFLLIRGRNALGLVSYAGAVLAKLHPALWFPLYIGRVGWKAASTGVAAGAVVAALYFTPDSLLRYVYSLRLYYRLFEFNAGVHYFLRYIGLEFYNRAWDQHTGPYLAAALLAICIIIWYRFPVPDPAAVLHGAFWIMTADLCLATTVHPWYLGWAAVALPLFPYAFMFYWTGAVFLSYMAYQYRPVFEPAWVLLLEYIPMYAFMLWEIRRRGPMLTGFGGGVRETKKAILPGVAAQG